MAKKEYIPFGEEWKKEMMKMSKSDIIDFLKRSLQEVKALEHDKPVDLLSEEEFNDWVNKKEPSAIVKARSSQFKKGMFTGYLVALQMIDERND